MNVRGTVAVLALIAAPWAKAQSDDVTFLVMGKTANHRQRSEGQLSLLNYHFFAEIFVKPGGRVKDASLVFPGGRVQPFVDLDYVWELHGGRYDREAELDRDYPNGDYGFRFDTPSGRVDGRLLSVRGTGAGASRIPPPVHVTLLQDGRAASPTGIDPGKDLTVTWSEFVGAGDDPRGVLNDLIFAVMGDCRGEKSAHSGRPFEGTPYLTHDATDYVIPAKHLAPGEAHQLFVEHAKVDTSVESGVVGLVTYAATTFLDFRTSGAPTGDPCPEHMPRMDEGQTDRGPR